MNAERETPLSDALSALACELRELRHERQHNHNHAILHRLAEMEQRIMATQSELVADLKSVTAQLTKLAGDTRALQTSVDTANAKIVELEALVAAGGTIGQDLVDAVAEVKTAVQVVDDNVPEVTAPKPPVA